MLRVVAVVAVLRGHASLLIPAVVAAASLVVATAVVATAVVATATRPIPVVVATCDESMN